MSPFIANPGDVISFTSSGSPFYVHLAGYLADENYFANCGGGGSSTTSSLDSTAIANMIAAAGGGCNFKYPDGLDGESITSTCTYSNPYIVPMNKRLIVLLTSNNTEINGVQLPQIDNGEVLILNSGDTFSPWNGIGDLDFNGLLIEPNNSVTSITSTCTYSNPYIVPTNKRLIVLLTSNNTEINGVQLPQIDQDELLILNSGDTFAPWNGIGDLDFNGYLADENYFANCGGGGGGSSATSSLDSTAIANMIAAAGGGGCDFLFPDGFAGNAITGSIDNTNPYIVPVGKRFYLLSWRNGDFIPSSIQPNYMGVSSAKPYIFESGESISTTSTGVSFYHGYLVDENPDVQAITGSIDNTNPYIVPVGKRFYLLSWRNGDFIPSSIQPNYMGVSSAKPYIFESGESISTTSTGVSFYHGYLVDENYFANCGGGGTSSTTTSSNSVGDFSYPDGKDNMIPIIHDLSASTYTVPSGKNLYITSYQGINSSDELKISLNTVFKGRGQYSNGQGAPVGLFELPLIASSAEIVSAPGKMNGFLVNESITPITFSLSGNYVNNITYTVPAGKILVLLNFYSAMNGGYGNLQADGMFQLYGIFNYFDNISGCSPACETTSIKNPMFFDENTIISTEGWGDFQVINGYLMDK